MSGGYGNGGNLVSTEVLDLMTHDISSAGEMATTRRYFHSATTSLGGEVKVFAISGYTGSKYLKTVEE